MEMTSIYVLKCPNTNEIRYVGQTNIPLKNRLYGHLYQSTNKKKFWVDGLKENELKPIIELVEDCISEVALIREQHWIKYYKTLGCDLLNVLDMNDRKVAYTKQYNVVMPADTDMEALKERLKLVKTKTGKTANAKIAAYILKLAK